jgi:hypothetical protein
VKVVAKVKRTSLSRNAKNNYQKITIYFQQIQQNNSQRSAQNVLGRIQPSFKTDDG